jgi:hypothetical protein
VKIRVSSFYLFIYLLFYVTQAVLEFTICLIQLPEHLNYRCVPLHLADLIHFNYISYLAGYVKILSFQRVINVRMLLIYFIFFFMQSSETGMWDVFYTWRVIDHARFHVLRGHMLIRWPAILDSSGLEELHAFHHAAHIDTTTTWFLFVSWMVLLSLSFFISLCLDSLELKF